MKKVILSLVLTLSFFSLLIGTAVLANKTSSVIVVEGAVIKISNPITSKTLGKFMERIATFIGYVGIAMVPLMILIGAYYLITGGGDPERISTGKRVLWYALIGLAVIMFAKGLAYMVRDVLGAK